jgi:DNA-binding GntR family transcriptional regulator
VPSHKLDEQERAPNYEVSRTPLRDALLELARSALNVLQHFSKF